MDGEKRPPPPGVKFDKFGRRVWDTDFFEKKANVVATDEDGDDVEFETLDSLKPRSASLDLDSKIGMRQLKSSTSSSGDAPIGATNPNAVFHCSLCKESFQSDAAYLDHLNSAVHNARKGMTLRANRGTLQGVLAILSKNPQKKRKGLSSAGAEATSSEAGHGHGSGGRSTLDELERRIEARMKRRRGERDAVKKNREKMQEDDPSTSGALLPDGFGRRRQ